MTFTRGKPNLSPFKTPKLRRVVSFALMCTSLVFHVDATTKKPMVSSQAIQSFYGGQSGKRANALNKLVAGLYYESEQTKLKKINDFFNMLTFVDDIDLWGTKDYWATPNEFIGAGAGDCEDFTIAKYLTLRRLGVADRKLRLIYVKSLTLNQFHMVLAYYETPSSVPVLLDNLDGDIKPATQRKDLLPIYSFNGENLWLMKRSGSGKIAGKASRLSSWNELRSRAKQTHFKRPKINYNE